ncbi:hypothetical protein Pan216_11340 [Planctomycetes bacterium Pan216]|uniref:Major pilin subunit n=1 Tax=Kolteria novifilia TaxID=2527975 RepID=A0A518B003_9BACT|nr:hypothetical protein Pan216_11340 [Planctomycetes bacterium Pan216]
MTRYIRFAKHRLSVSPGFTLIEMLVVIIIATTIAAIALPTLSRMAQGDQVRAGARQLQALLVAARDKALAADEPRGVRLLQDPDDLSLVRSIIFVEPAEPISAGGASASTDTAGSVRVVRQVTLAANSDGDTQELVAAQLQQLPQSGTNHVGVIRLGHAGQYHSFNVAAGSRVLTLDTPLPVGAASTTGRISDIEYVIPRPPVPIADGEVNQLPKGVAIDLGQMPASLATAVDASESRLSRLTRDENALAFDIMFAPDGRVIGSAARDSQIALWLRDEFVQDVSRNTAYSNRREVQTQGSDEHLLIVVHSRSGLVHAVRPLLQVRSPDDGFYDFDHYYDNVVRGYGTGL